MKIKKEVYFDKCKNCNYIYAKVLNSSDYKIKYCSKECWLSFHVTRKI